MKIVKELVGGARLLATPRFEDDRGAFSVWYEQGAAGTVGMINGFVQDNHSTSTSVGTIRGLHLQLPPHEQGKLVRVLRGRVLDVVVDLRPGSPSLGQWESVELVAGPNVLWIPPGFGHGFCTLEPDTEVFYKVDAVYAPSHEISLRWDDPVLGIDWRVPSDDVVLSAKDASGLDFHEVLSAIEAAQDVELNR